MYVHMCVLAQERQNKIREEEKEFIIYIHIYIFEFLASEESKIFFFQFFTLDFSLQEKKKEEKRKTFL